jgi:hypothetical protein
MKHDKEGKAYFWHVRQRRATWNRPHPEEEHALAMPEGWKEYDDKQGRRYYHNTRQRSSTWTHPATRAAHAHARLPEEGGAGGEAVDVAEHSGTPSRPATPNLDDEISVYSGPAFGSVYSLKI